MAIVEMGSPMGVEAPNGHRTAVMSKNAWPRARRPRVACHKSTQVASWCRSGESHELRAVGLWVATVAWVAVVSLISGALN